jgi:Uma2 family endonuclease
MSIQTTLRMTAGEYLTIEREAETRSEYVDGEMFAMAGASRRHNLIVTNIVRELSAQLRDRSCDVYANDMRVKVSPTGLYTYPDVVLACDEIRFEDEHEDTLLNPILLIEVLSPSTQGYDRFQKFSHYRRLPSLREYLLIAQDQHRVEHYRRQSENQWLLSEAGEPDEMVTLDSIGCRLAIKDIYEKVDIEPSFPGASTC